MRDLFAIGRLHLVIFVTATAAVGICACEKESPPAQSPHGEGPCDPPIDLESCDGERRLTCDAVAKIWVEIETCEAPTQCTEIDLEDEGPAMATECAAEQGP